MAGPDFDTRIKQLQATMHTIEQVLDLGRMRAEIEDLGQQVAAPDLWDDQANAQRVTGRLSGLQGAGSIGLFPYLNSSATNAPIQARYDNLRAALASTVP